MKRCDLGSGRSGLSPLPAALALGCFLAFSNVSVSAQNCTIDYSNVFQRIDGFGASSAWNGSISTTQGNLLYSTNTNIVYTDNLGARSTNNGIGLSLLRTRIA